MSLFLWSALITVTLAALSLGYALGGRWADRGPTFRRLGLLVALAGAWILLVPLLRRPVLIVAEPLGLRAAVLSAATLLFAPPLALLGMVSPYAIRLKASQIEHVGRTAGNLYAVSTVASVVSALAMGFFLIPSLGVTRLTLAIGFVLLLASLLAISPRDARTSTVTTVLLLALAVSLGRMTPLNRRPNGVLAVHQSPYGEIRVVESGGRRHLLIDGGVHSVVSNDTWESWHPYTAAFDALKYLFDTRGSMLLIGLGGGSVVKSFARDGWKIDAVEIDATVAQVAREYFGLTPDEYELHVMDGRRYLSETPFLYDLILVDAFGSSSIPFHLATVEAFGLAASRLKPGGVLAMNVETHGWHDPLAAALAATLERHFTQVVALPLAEPPDALGNLVLVASNRELEFDEYALLPRPFDFLHLEHGHWWSVELAHAWDNRFRPATQNVRPLTDDLNCVDVLSEPINRDARKKLHAYFNSNQAASW